MKNPAYSALGGVFEKLNADCGYKEWAEYIIALLKSNGAQGKGVDIGCGNGYFTRALYRAGYDVTGMDISPQMLSTAVETARKEGLPVSFLQGDITKLNLNFKAGFITAVNDCLNYVPHAKLKHTFSGIYKNLAKGGVFIFDISTPEKLTNKIGNNVFADDGGDVTYIWFNTLKEDRVEMDITVFTRCADGRYSRLDEAQTQYIHGLTEVQDLLKEAGFRVSREGHLGGDSSDRVNFICTKA